MLAGVLDEDPGTRALRHVFVGQGPPPPGPGQPPSTFTARVWTAAASDPAPGSLKSWQNSISPSMLGRNQRSTCSGVPCCAIVKVFQKHGSGHTRGRPYHPMTQVPKSENIWRRTSGDCVSTGLEAADRG